MIIDKEFAALIPPLTDEEYRGLEASILAEGCRDALVAWGEVLIDGHNRYRICTEHNIPYQVLQRDFADRNEAKLWMIRNQLSRRNLPNFVRSELALKLKPVIAEIAKENQRMGAEMTNTGLEISPKAINTREEVAHAAGVSDNTIAKVEKIIESAPEEVKTQLRKGEMSINQAYKDIKNAERKANIQRQVEELEQHTPEVPDGLFDVIVMDPPWAYGTGYDADGRRCANPYPEMTQEQLKAIELPAAENCVLFLWTTHKFIWDAKELLNTWGFEYRNILVWDKQVMGMGNLFRMRCEFCLVGIKGKPIFRDVHNLEDIIEEKRREHSRKPEGFYELVNTLCVGRKLDYFSRSQREGWEVFGNDTDKFSVA